MRHVRSVSRSGQSDVILEFAWGTNMDLAGIDVREKLDLLQLPIEARRPLLLRFDPASELSRLTTRVDVDVELSTLLFEAVQFAIAVAEELAPEPALV